MLEAGRYFIGDPGNVIKYDIWEKFLQEYDDRENIHNIGGNNVFVRECISGSGIFTDLQENHMFSVYSGFIGATPVVEGLVHPDIIKYGVRDDLGVIYHFKKPFDCWVEENGVIVIANIFINTRFEDMI